MFQRSSVCYEILILCMTLPIGVPNSAYLSANATCSAEKRDFFIP